ncbi:MAG: GNAT family N-acetyltransferase [Croceibacterium sp.]
MAGAADWIIREASSDADFDAFGRQCLAYTDWCRARYADLPWLVEMVFGFQSLEAELRDLRRKYAPPDGRTLVLERDGVITGAGAFRRLSDEICELKRVFVSETMRGTGAGRALTLALIDQTRTDGFIAMRLDTGDRFTEALALYRSIGFEPIAPYLQYPPQLMPHMRFLELSLLAR